MRLFREKMCKRYIGSIKIKKSLKNLYNADFLNRVCKSCRKVAVFYEYYKGGKKVVMYNITRSFWWENVGGEFLIHYNDRWRSS